MDHLTALRVFRSAAERGSFVAASRRLGLSTSAVSKNIRELEDHLGTRLFHRTTRRIALTEEGSVYYERICPVLDGLAEAEGLVDGEEWPQDLGASGVVSLVHRWTFSVDAAGTAVLPGADLPVLRQRLVLRTEAYNSIAGLFAADSQRVTFLVAECLGTVARLRSEVDELDPDFTRTTEILRFGLAAELLP